MKTMKKVLASLLVLCMILALPNMTAWADTTGTSENPEVITTLGGVANQLEGVEGYYYSYTATEAGVLTLGAASCENTDASVYKKVTNTTTYESNTSEIYASVGDVLVIWVSAEIYSYDWDTFTASYTYPATAITWSASFEATSDIEWANGQTAVVEGEDETLYYIYEAPETLVGINDFVLTVDSVELGENVDLTAEDIYYMVRLENLTTGDVISASYYWWDDEPTNTAKIKVQAGEKILVKVQGKGASVATGEVDEYNAPVYETVYPEIAIDWNVEVNQVGTSENPEVIDSLENHSGYGSYLSTVIVPDSEGFYYTYVVEADGTFVINTYDSVVITVTNQNNESVSLSYGSLELEVTEGDELTIKILDATVYGDGDEKVSFTAGWNVEIILPEGTVDNPITPDRGYEVYDEENPYLYTLQAGATVYFDMANYDTWTMYIQGPATQTWGVVLPGSAMPVLPDENGVVSSVVASVQVGPWQYAAEVVLMSQDTEDIDLTIIFEAEEGTYYNPTEIEIPENETSTTVDKELEADHSTYYYEWIATSNAYLNFTINSSVENVWFFSLYSDNEDSSDYFYGYGNNEYYTPCNSALLYVETGDVVTISVSATDCVNGYAKVAATISLTLELLSLDEGSEKSAIEDIKNFVPETDEEGNPLEEQDPVQITLLDKDGNLVGLVTKEVLEAAKEAGTDIAFWVAEDVAWLIDADTLGDALTDVDFSVAGDTVIPEEMTEAIVGENDGYTFSIAHDGDFGFTVVLGLILGDENSDYTGMYANLFYYNEATGGLEFVVAYEMEDANTALFEMTHASDYVVVMSEEAMSADDNIIPATGDFSSTMLYVIVLLGAALVSAGFVAKKRFA